MGKEKIKENSFGNIKTVCIFAIPKDDGAFSPDNIKSEKMINQILEKANQVVRNANFTEAKKRSKAGNCFLIVTTPDFDLYGSFHSQAVYAVAQSQVYLLK